MQNSSACQYLAIDTIHESTTNVILLITKYLSPMTQHTYERRPNQFTAARGLASSPSSFNRRGLSFDPLINCDVKG